MAQIVWDEIGDRKFEVGVDRGVLYTDNAAVPWNGLISVEVSQEEFTVTPVYYDGRKVNELAFLGDFSATIKAYTYPDEFLPFDGLVEFVDGIYIDGQPRNETFGLSYRTLVGDDVDGIDLGYKIHLLYKMTAAPNPISNQTAGDEMSPIEFEWNVTSVPDEIVGYRPSSHIVIDSTKVDSVAMADVESVLYGTESESPRLPTMQELYEMIFRVLDYENGVWAVIGPLGDTLSVGESGDTFTIDSSRVTILDADPDLRYTVSY